MPTIHNILLIQTASIGDVILATPILERIHETLPDCNIDLLVRKGHESLFANHPFLNQLLLWDKKSHKHRNLLHLLMEIRKSRYDAVITVQRFASSGLLTAYSGARHRVGFSKNPLSFAFSHRVKHLIGNGDQQPHEVERNLTLIEWLVGKTNGKPRLYPTAADFARTSALKQKQYVCIAPASLWFTKQFPENQWVDVMQKLPPEMNVYLLGSPSDLPLCERILKAAGHINSINLAGKLNLLESAALMRDATMNFVNDSAPMHLCSAVNARQTVIYCSTVPAFGFGPLSDDAVIVETEKNLSCRPCGLHGYQSCPQKHFKCATTINPNKLLSRI